MFLALKYREILQEGGCLPQLRDVGFRVFSQNDEDGILLFIFSLISAKNRRSVEICAGDGIECNTANLIVNHYWAWKAITCVSPREGFNRKAVHPDYCGASLPAFVKLGSEKGYRLIGCNRYGFNAFFMRNDIAEELFPEVSADSCLEHPMAIQGRETRLPQVINFKWIEV